MRYRCLYTPETSFGCVFRIVAERHGYEANTMTTLVLTSRTQTSRTQTRIRMRRLLGVGGSLAALGVAACNNNSVTNPAAGQPLRQDQVSLGTVPVQASPADLAMPPTQPNAQMQAVVAQLMAANVLPPYTLTPAQARNQPTPRDAVLATLAAQGRPASAAVEPVAKVVHRTIPGPAGPLITRIYTPAGQGPFPVLVYYHGGGWVLYDLDVYDASCRALANAAGAVVVSVAYRRAPEHQFPAAADDAFAAYRWALDSAGTINGNPAKVAVGGESVGGNLAAVVSLMARDQKIKLPVHQLLIYPVLDFNFDTPSYHQNANSPFFSRLTSQWVFDKYLRTQADGNNPYVSPLRANLAGLPPATIIATGLGVLISEDSAYAVKLKAAGVPTVYQAYPGTTHEFFSMTPVLDDAKAAVQLAATRLKQSYGTP